MGQVAISDFVGHDKVQYFRKTYVRVKTDSGWAVGYVENINDEYAVVSFPDVGMRHVPLDHIDWRGLPKPACVCFNGVLYFIAPLGARTQRKPCHAPNLGVVSFNGEGVRRFLSGQHAIPDALIRIYLSDPMYPTNQDALSFQMREQTCIALTPNVGVLVKVTREQQFHEDYDPEDPDHDPDDYYLRMVHKRVFQIIEDTVVTATYDDEDEAFEAAWAYIEETLTCNA